MFVQSDNWVCRLENWVVPLLSFFSATCLVAETTKVCHVSPNRSAHTDARHQVAASRRVLCAGGLQRLIL